MKQAESKDNALSEINLCDIPQTLLCFHHRKRQRPFHNSNYCSSINRIRMIIIIWNKKSHCCHHDNLFVLLYICQLISSIYIRSIPTATEEHWSRRVIIIYCGLLTLHDNIDLSQHWLRLWLVAWRHQAISRKNPHYGLVTSIWGNLAIGTSSVNHLN